MRRHGIAGHWDVFVCPGGAARAQIFRMAASSNARNVRCWDAVGVAFSVLIVDDDQLFLEAARVLLERDGLRVIGGAATPAEALQRARELRPDVVLVDIALGEENGFDLARRLAGGGSTVIMISTRAGADYADLVADSPAAGFLPKDKLSAAAIRRIADRG